MRVQCQRPLEHMQIPISLLDAVAPKTCELVSELAQTGCTTCRFYRNELPPEVRGQTLYPHTVLSAAVGKAVEMTTCC